MRNDAERRSDGQSGPVALSRRKGCPGLRRIIPLGEIGRSEASSLIRKGCLVRHQ